MFDEPRRTYSLLSSPDLTTWTRFSTNTIGSENLWVPISVTPDQPHRFFRAVWVP